MTKEILVKDVMSKPVTIAKSAPITEALDKMLDQGSDPLIVMNHNTVVGTISRRTIAETLGSKKNSGLSPTAIHVANSVEEEFTPVYPDQTINVVVPLLQTYKLVVVYDQEHRLIGQVTPDDVLKVATPDADPEEVMEKAVTIDVDERVVHLRRRMIDDNILRFIVTDQDRIVGIVTETDVAVAMRKFREMVEDRHQDHRIRNLIVRDIMTTPVLSVEKGSGVVHARDLIISKKISSVPVTDQGRILGIITRAALINAL
jgi:predicted transcriptional regulator